MTECTEIRRDDNLSKPEQYLLTLFDISIDPGLKDEEGNQLPRPYNKNQMRKWLKRVKWENRKADKRAKEKAKCRERRRLARESHIDLGPTRKALKKIVSQRHKSSTTVIIDLSFEHLMFEKQRFKLIKQILRCYSINRRASKPVQLTLTNFGGKTMQEMSRHNGYEHWDVIFEKQSYIDSYPKQKLVYLSSESNNVIESFEGDTCYIIGGLVDHNEHKGLCFKIACEQGIRHGRLPLDEYINMNTRKVLTIDHVFEIIIKVIGGKGWPEALLTVLPQRKGANLNDNVTTCSSLGSNDIMCNKLDDIAKHSESSG